MHRDTPNNITESILDIFRNVSIFYQQKTYIKDQNKRFHRQSVNYYYLYFHPHIILYTSTLIHTSHPNTLTHIFFFLITTIRQFRLNLLVYRLEIL